MFYKKNVMQNKYKQVSKSQKKGPEEKRILKWGKWKGENKWEINSWNCSRTSDTSHNWKSDGGFLCSCFASNCPFVCVQVLGMEINTTKSI